jgi:hypothetical protein
MPGPTADAAHKRCCVSFSALLLITTTTTWVLFHRLNLLESSKCQIFAPTCSEQAAPLLHPSSACNLTQFATAGRMGRQRRRVSRHCRCVSWKSLFFPAACSWRCRGQAPPPLFLPIQRPSARALFALRNTSCTHAPCALKSVAGIAALSAFAELHIVTSRQLTLQPATHAFLEQHFPGKFASVQFGNHWGATGGRRSKRDMCRDVGALLLIDDNLQCVRHLMLRCLSVTLGADTHKTFAVRA